MFSKPHHTANRFQRNPNTPGQRHHPNMPNTPDVRRYLSLLTGMTRLLGPATLAVILCGLALAQASAQARPAATQGAAPAASAPGAPVAPPAAPVVACW